MWPKVALGLILLFGVIWTHGRLKSALRARRLAHIEHEQYQAFLLGRQVALEQVHQTLAVGQSLDSLTTPDRVQFLECLAAQHWGQKHVPPVTRIGSI